MLKMRLSTAMFKNLWSCFNFVKEKELKLFNFVLFFKVIEENHRKFQTEKLFGNFHLKWKEI